MSVTLPLQPIDSTLGSSADNPRCCHLHNDLLGIVSPIPQYRAGKMVAVPSITIGKQSLRERYQHPDSLGSVRLWSDAQGSMVGWQDYTAFGVPMPIGSTIVG